jgi:eukaryotic-like serine/threonine-protein kinase
MTEPLQVPRVLSGRYELVHLIARGGMAEVYRARDRQLDRPVALKILFPELSVDRSFVERFRREAQAAANLSHPNIVPVFDWGEDEGTYYIVMEFVDGRTLSSILRSAGELHPDRAAEIAADVAGALAYAHRHQVVHRDVKPGNILITNEGAVKVTDFGIARALNTEESLTQTGAVMGTATYFSPEQAEGIGVDARSDIYSLGVVLFEMVTGRPPFLGDTPVAVASKHVREHPPVPREINPTVPPDLEAIILKCLAKSPEYRYASGEDLRADLLRFREGRSVAATIPPMGMGTTRAMTSVGRTEALPQTWSDVLDYEEPPKSRTRVYVAILVLLLAALAVVLIFLGQSLGWWHLGSNSSAINLPDVYGKTVTQAEATLHADGLKTTVKKDSSSTASTTQVVRTDPPKGSSVKKGDTVVLFTGSKAPATSLTVPSNLIGQSVSAAESQLQSMGLASTVSYSSSCSQLNVVCNTSPTGGSPVSRGATVTLYTAQNTTTTVPVITVPDVTNDTPDQACNILGQRGYVCGTTSYQSSSTITQGYVIATSPAVGTQLASGNTVNLIVSNGPSTVSVPGVTGETYGDAKSAIRSAGLTPATDGSCTADGNTVSNQSPTAGNQAAPGATVTLSCSSSPTTTTTAPTTGVLAPNPTASGDGNGASNENGPVNSSPTNPGAAADASPGGSTR